MSIIKKIKKQKEKEEQKQREKKQTELELARIRKEEKIKEEQLNELNSEEFKRISKFVNEYEQRKYLDKEKNLFDLIKSFTEQDKQEACLNNQYKINYEKERINKLFNYINELTEEEKESNIYLKTAYLLLEQSKIDCQKIISKLLERIESQIIFNDISSKRNINTKYQIKIDVEEKNLEIILRKAKTIKYIYYQPYPNSKEYHTSFMHVLDEENIKYYQKYNEIVCAIHLLTSYIYRLRNSSILFNYLEENTNQIKIENYHGEITTNNIVVDTENYNNKIFTNFSVDIHKTDNIIQKNSNYKHKILKKIPKKI